MQKILTTSIQIAGSLLFLLIALNGNSATGTIEEIVVTATHRPQSVQDIPISVTALGAEQLKKSDIFDAATIAQHVPGMHYAEFAAGQALISMRGISSIDDGAGLDNSVALFLDGVYVGRNGAINFDMFDLERIEVLRGPQGTLFGRNAIGGAINVVSSKPSDEFTFRAGVTAGNEGIFRYQGLVSGPLSDNLAGKLSLTHREHDGYVKNVLLDTDLQDEDQISVRGQLRLTLDNSEWLLSADIMDDDRADMGRTGVADNAPLSLIMAANGVDGPREQASPYDGFSKREANGISLQGDIEFDTGTLTTITAFRHTETDWEMQSVGAGLGALGLPFDEVIDDIIEDIDTFSQELRWTSNIDGNFSYVAGAYFFTEDTDRTEQFKITRAGTYGDPANPFRITDVGSQDIIGNEYTRTENETTSWALYANGDWQLSEKVTVSLGARFTKDSKDYVATAVNCGLDLSTTAFANFPACAGVGGSLRIVAEAFRVTPDDSWSDFSPKASIQYYPNDDVMFFAAISKGFKSGGFAGSQGIESSASTPVDPEEAINYELGIKSDLLNNTLRINVTAFYTDYDDLQIVRFGPVAGSAFGTFVTANIGSAEILGAELEFQWYITENFSLSGNYAYLDTEVNGLVLETTGGPVDASGSSLRQAPKNSSSLILGYERALASGIFEAQLEYSYADEAITDYIDQRTRVEQVELWDARISWTSDDETWDISIWGKNLRDEAWIAHSYVIGPGVIGIWGPPRTIGLTATYSM